jgi:MFS family permease
MPTDQTATSGYGRIDDLRACAIDILRGLCHSDEHAALIADVLVDADLRGYDDHGVAMLTPFCMVQKIGRLNALGLGLLAGSTLAGGRLGNVPLRPLLIASTLLQAAVMAIALLAPLGAVAFIGAMALAGAIGGVGGPAVALLLLNGSPAGRGTTMTLNQSLFSLGIALGSAVGGLLLGVVGYTVIAYSILVFNLAACALVCWLRPGAGAGTRLAARAKGHEMLVC